MTDIEVYDSFGRRTVFRGDQLVSDTTDTDDRRKPQWLDIDIWRTEGGSFVVKKAVQYRLVHATRGCRRAEGYDLRPAGRGDTHPCPACTPEALPPAGGWAQQPRVMVDAYRTPEDLIESLKVDGKFTRLSRALLADLSDADERINALWNTVVVD